MIAGWPLRTQSDLAALKLDTAPSIALASAHGAGGKTR